MGADSRHLHNCGGTKVQSSNRIHRRTWLQSAAAALGLGVSSSSLRAASGEAESVGAGTTCAAPDDRYTRGWRQLEAIDGDAGRRVIAALEDVAPDLARYTIEFPFGDIYSRPGLDLRAREVATVAALTALGVLPQLKVHIHGALNVGCSRKEVIEIIIQMAVYAGFPAALNAAGAAGEVFAERDVMEPDEG